MRLHLVPSHCTKGLLFIAGSCLLPPVSLLCLYGKRAHAHRKLPANCAFFFEKEAFQQNLRLAAWSGPLWGSQPSGLIR